MAKAVTWVFPDAEARKLGERNRLETCVVLAVNDVRELSLIKFMNIIRRFYEWRFKLTR